MLIRSGQVDKGLAQMIRLSAKETCGRNRFQRKLLLAEVCLASKRERLARSILEELAEQIDKPQAGVLGIVRTHCQRMDPAVQVVQARDR